MVNMKILLLFIILCNPISDPTHKKKEFNSPMYTQLLKNGANDANDSFTYYRILNAFLFVITMTFGHT